MWDRCPSLHILHKGSTRRDRSVLGRGSDDVPCQAEPPGPAQLAAGIYLGVVTLTTNEAPSTGTVRNGDMIFGINLSARSDVSHILISDTCYRVTSLREGR